MMFENWLALKLFLLLLQLEKDESLVLYDQKNWTIVYWKCQLMEAN